MSVRLAELKDFSGFREKKKGSETRFALISHITSALERESERVRGKIIRCFHAVNLF